MNASFSFSRLILLIRKQWSENYRFYGLASLALLGVMAIVFILFWILSGYPNYHEEQTIFIYFIGLFLVGCIFASIAFQALGEKEKGQYLLSIPATHAEKLVTVILFSSVLFFLVYTACFFIVKWLAVWYVHLRMGIDPAVHYQTIHWDQNQYRAIPYVFLAFFALQALFLLGSVYFKKYAYIKTIIISICFAAAYSYFVAKLYDLNLPPNYNWEGIRVVFNNLPDDDSIYHEYSFGETFNSIFLFVIKWIWAPVFWVVAWFRLKEKEI